MGRREHWQWEDFEHALGEALGWVFHESGGTLGYNAAMGAAMDIADRYAMDSYLEGKRHADAVISERDRLKDELSALKEEADELRERAADAERAALALSPMGFDDYLEARTASRGIGRCSLTAQVGNGDDCLMMLSDYLLGDGFLDNLQVADVEERRFEIMDAILRRRSQRYRDENREAPAKGGKGGR